MQSAIDPQFTRPALSVIIPAYNEGVCIVQSLDKLRTFAGAWAMNHGPIEAIIVDDGSTDDTAHRARSFEPGPNLRVQVLVNSPNRGKGFSVQRGMLQAAGDRLLFADADFSTPIEELHKLWIAMDGGAAVAIGSRAVADSKLDPPQGPLRRLLGHAFRTASRIAGLGSIRDTQCGFKCFTREAATRIFQAQQETGFAFDCEILALAKHFQFRIAEVGVRWSNDPRSSVKIWRDGPRMLAALFRIRKRVRLLH